MQIGRRIYYDKVNGSIIQDTGERRGSVYVTTNEEDFLAFPSLHGRSLIETAVKELFYNERIGEFINMGSYHMDVVSGELIIYPHLIFTQDKTQIIPDGVDALTIVVSTSNVVSDIISFKVGATTQSIPTDANGQAVFQLVSAVPGDFTISISSTKYGSSTTTVKAV